LGDRQQHSIIIKNRNKTREEGRKSRGDLLKHGELAKLENDRRKLSENYPLNTTKPPRAEKEKGAFSKLEGIGGQKRKHRAREIQSPGRQKRYLSSKTPETKGA